MTELTKADAAARIRRELFVLDPIAKELHAKSCAARGEEPQWNGRRTNRAYYRRLARASAAGRAVLSQEDKEA